MKYSIAFLVMVASLLGTISQVEADTPLQRKSLKGLPGVLVIVESLERKTEQEGLPSSSISTDVELKLRNAGIRILTEEQRLKVPGRPYFYVNVNVLKSKFGLYAFSITIELYQQAQLTRDPRLELDVPTWDKSRIGVVGPDRLRDIREDVKDLVDAFINAYLAANQE